MQSSQQLQKRYLRDRCPIRAANTGRAEEERYCGAGEGYLRKESPRL